MATNADLIEWEEIDKLFYEWFSAECFGSSLTLYLSGFENLHETTQNPLWIVCLYVYSSVFLSELIKRTRFEQKLPQTFGSRDLREWMTGLETPMNIYPHLLLWSLYVTSEGRGDKGRWNQLAPCIRRYFNPADLALGKAMSRRVKWGFDSTLLEREERTELYIQLAGLIEALVAP